MEVASKRQKALSLLAVGNPLKKVAKSLGVHRAICGGGKEPQLVADWNKMLAEMKERQILILAKIQEEGLGALYYCLNRKLAQCDFGQQFL